MIIDTKFDDISCFRHNFTQPDVFTPDDSAAWHKMEVEWLKNEIGKATHKGNTVIVLTHHTPSYKVSGESYYSLLEGLARATLISVCPGSGLAFSSDLEYLFKNGGTNVAVWAHGHTHYNDDVIIRMLADSLLM